MRAAGRRYAGNGQMRDLPEVMPPSCGLLYGKSKAGKSFKTWLWDTPEAERERSLNLNVGYDEISRTWELIVRHRGSVKWLEDAAGVPGIGYPAVNELSGGYAVLRVPEAAVGRSEPSGSKSNILRIRKGCSLP